MILKKPYAFFIKNFKLMHLIMSILTLFVIGTLYNIYLYVTYLLNMNIASEVGRDLITDYYSNNLVINPIISLLFIALILITLIFKKKPFKIYIYYIFSYIFTIVFASFIYNFLAELSEEFVELRAIKAIKDITLINIGILVLVFIKLLITATGFDIKKFDFKKDLKDLEIVEEDEEEFEVEINIEGNVIIRKIKFFLRHMKYYYVENRLYINILLSIGFVLASATLIFRYNVYYARYGYNQSFSIDGNRVEVVGSYLTEEDYLKKDVNNSKYILIDTLITNFNNDKNTFSDARIRLKLDNKTYYPTYIMPSSFQDLGTLYNNQKLIKEPKRYIFQFKITNSNFETADLIFLENVEYIKGDFRPSEIAIDLSLSNLDKIRDNINLDMKEELHFKNIARETKLQINSYKLSNEIKLNYDFCISSNNCNNSVEYIRPKYNSNLEKAILWLNMQKLDSEFGTSNPYEFIKKYSRIEYKVNDKTKTYRISDYVSPKNPLQNNYNKDYFIEVPKEMLEASEIALVFENRNTIYKYNIKK